MEALREVEQRQPFCWRRGEQRTSFLDRDRNSLLLLLFRATAELQA